MALIKCPNCGGQISDKAAACVHCGYSMCSADKARVNLAEGFDEEKQPPVENLAESVPTKKGFKLSKRMVAVIAAIIAIILIAILILPHTICLSHSYSEATVFEPQTCYHCGKTAGEPKPLTEVEFPTKGVGSLLPIPSSNMGEINWEESNSFNVYVGNTSEEDFDDYVKTCSDHGFDVDYQKDDDYYYAKDIYGNDLNIWYKGNNIMQIQIFANVEEENNEVVDLPLPEETADDAQEEFIKNGCFTYTARSFMERFDEAYNNVDEYNYMYMRANGDALYYELVEGATYDDIRTVGMVGFSKLDDNDLSADDDYAENIIHTVNVLVEDVDDAPMILVGCMCAADPSLNFTTAYSIGQDVVECAGTYDGYTHNGINYLIVTDDEYYYIIISVVTEDVPDASAEDVVPPVVEEPAAEEPVYEESSYDEPYYEEPIYEETIYVDPAISSNVTSVYLEEFSEEVYITVDGLDEYTVVCEVDDGSIVECFWGEWDWNTVPLYIEPLSSGNTTVRVYIEDYEYCFVTIAVSVDYPYDYDYDYDYEEEVWDGDEYWYEEDWV